MQNTDWRRLTSSLFVCLNRSFECVLQPRRVDESWRMAADMGVLVYVFHERTHTAP